ncbi:MAG TPA: hypothetical protein VM686_40440, partial [Polyangiaceae bacterium]|nr:hypothetical protein [Polyangiaceae bacterium]
MAAGCGPATAPSAKAPPTSQPAVRYCGGTVTEHEVHRCIWELTEAQQRRRGYSQRLVYENGRLARFEEINGLGVTLDGNYGSYGVSVYAYEGDRVSGQSLFDRNGVPRGTTRLSADGTRVEWLDEKGRPRVREGTRASGLIRTLDQRGRVSSYRYVDAKGAATPSASGRIEVRAKRNEAGALVENAVFDEQGSPMRDSSGVHREVFTVDDHGIPTRTEYFGTDGQPIENNDGYHRVDYQFDEVGNKLAEAYFDVRGRPTRSAVNGAASFRMQNDAHGNETSRTYFDEYGEPLLSKHGYVTRKILVDAAGDEIEWSFHGFGGELIPFGPGKHAIKREQHDERGNEILERFFDANDRPIAIESGFHAIKLAYDERDNVVLGTYLDKDLKPARTTKIYASWKYGYDGDRRVLTQYLSPEQTLMDAGWGYAEIRHDWDELGVEGGKRYFNARGREVAHPDVCPPH